MLWSRRRWESKDFWAKLRTNIPFFLPNYCIWSHRSDSCPGQAILWIVLIQINYCDTNHQSASAPPLHSKVTSGPMFLPSHPSTHYLLIGSSGVCAPPLGQLRLLLTTQISHYLFPSFPLPFPATLKSRFQVLKLRIHQYCPCLLFILCRPQTSEISLYLSFCL